MKKLLSVVLCFVLMMFCTVTAMAHEGHDHDSSEPSATESLPLELDQDQDGIADYMDAYIDVDGDDVQGVGPTYQQPGESKLNKKAEITPIESVMLVMLAVILVAVVIAIVKKVKKPDQGAAKES